jgi:hypothetical protein
MSGQKQAGSSPTSPDSVADWVLGGHRRRLVLERLLAGGRDRWTVGDLQAATGCGQATAYEVLRVLRAIELIHPGSPRDGYAVDGDHLLLEPLSNLIAVLQGYVDTPVDRPARGRRRG